MERTLMGEKELIDALRQGQNAAWTELVNRYVKLVCHVVRRTIVAYLREAVEADVEDVAYELFSALCRDGYKALAAIGPPYDLKAWLAISARRRAIDFVRRKRVAPVSLDDRRAEDDMTLGAAVAAKPEADDQEAGIRRAAMAKALESLSAKERLVVQLFYLKGMKYREIAKMTGVNINSISPTLMRAVEKMQKILAERT
jgi:RNA polymerase sigma-70 factor (ECF subfamily)